MNVVGCLIPGPLSGDAATAAASSRLRLLPGPGFCGALTTYSAFPYETSRPAEDGARSFAAADVVAGLPAGPAAAFAGVPLANALWA
ncbi:hypothetical protein ACE1SV_70960 [Streptomyces sp. E-15]